MKPGNFSDIFLASFDVRERGQKTTCRLYSNQLAKYLYIKLFSEVLFEILKNKMCFSSDLWYVHKQVGAENWSKDFCLIIVVIMNILRASLWQHLLNKYMTTNMSWVTTGWRWFCCWVALEFFLILWVKAHWTLCFTQNLDIRKVRPKNQVIWLFRVL